MQVRTLLAIVASVVVIATPPLFARAFPMVLMFHGGALAQPVFATPQSVPEAEAQVRFWCGRGSLPIEARTMMAERPFVNIAVFWIPWQEVSDPEARRARLATLKPDQAHQHGRIDVAKGSVRAAAVMTPLPTTSRTERNSLGFPAFVMQRPPAGASEFTHGCWLTDADVETAKALGVTLR
jgi:hypothetical protein